MLVIIIFRTLLEGQGRCSDFKITYDYKEIHKR